MSVSSDATECTFLIFFQDHLRLAAAPIKPLGVSDEKELGESEDERDESTIEKFI